MLGFNQLIQQIFLEFRKFVKALMGGKSQV